MHGFGRAYPFLMNDLLRADERRVADEWRRLHRMPDAPPLPAARPDTYQVRGSRRVAVGPLVRRFLGRGI